MWPTQGKQALIKGCAHAAVQSTLLSPKTRQEPDGQPSSHACGNVAFGGFAIDDPGQPTTHKATEVEGISQHIPVLLQRRLEALDEACKWKEYSAQGTDACLYLGGRAMTDS
jgi:hypothetical protein